MVQRAVTLHMLRAHAVVLTILCDDVRQDKRW